MNWVLTVLLCAVLVEVLIRLPLARPIEQLARSGSSALHVMTAKAVSDHWKEKAMGAYARATFMGTLKVAILLAFWLGVAVVLVLGLDLLSGGFQAFLLSWKGIGFTIVAGSLYAVARRALVRG